MKVIDVATDISLDQVSLYSPYTITPHYSTWEIENQLSKIKGFAGHFAGINYYNPETINLFRTLLNQHPGKLYKQVTISSELLTAKAEELQKFIANHIAKLEDKENQDGQNSDLQTLAKLKTLNKSITEYLTSNKPDAAWLLSAYMWAASSISDLASCEEEIDFLQHFIDPTVNLRNYYDYDLSNKVGSWAIVDALMDIDLPSYQKKSVPLYDMSYAVLDKLSETISANLPMPLYYPVAGIGKFGLSLLVRAMLKQEYLLGLSHRRENAHGISMNPLSFILNDVFHANVDPRGDSLIRYAAEIMDSYIKEGGDFTAGLPIVASYVVKRYSSLISSLEHIYDRFLRDLYPRYGKEELNKVMVGYFYLLHEKYFIQEGAYKTPDLEKILLSIEEDNKDDLKDPFYTSPINGNILLETEEELNKVIAVYKLKALKDPRYYDLSEDSYTGCEVISTERFIDLTFSFRNGTEVKYSVPTLCNEWFNLDDTIALLKMFGIKVAKPELNVQDPMQSRQLAIETLNLVQQHLADVIKHFQQRAIFFINYVNPKTGVSLSQEFFDEFMQQQADLQQELRAAKPQRVQAVNKIVRKVIQGNTNSVQPLTTQYHLYQNNIGTNSMGLGATVGLNAVANKPQIKP